MRNLITAGRIGTATQAGTIGPVLDLPVDQRPVGVTISPRRVHRALTTGPPRPPASAPELMS
ncbi:hypothetical protein H7827_26155 [Streptomyces sp. JH002]|uniref:hypothetical protein n=1 Tax=Streptomyces sp. JH002 TaxID=2763259 RepID=UPI003D80233C